MRGPWLSLGFVLSFVRSPSALLKLVASKTHLKKQRVDGGNEVLDEGSQVMA